MMIFILRPITSDLCFQFYTVIASFVFRLLVIRGVMPTWRTAVGLICGISLPLPIILTVNPDEGSILGIISHYPWCTALELVTTLIDRAESS